MTTNSIIPIVQLSLEWSVGYLQFKICRVPFIFTERNLDLSPLTRQDKSGKATVKLKLTRNQKSKKCRAKMKMNINEMGYE